MVFQIREGRTRLCGLRSPSRTSEREVPFGDPGGDAATVGLWPWPAWDGGLPRRGWVLLFSSCAVGMKRSQPVNLLSPNAKTIL